MHVNQRTLRKTLALSVYMLAFTDLSGYPNLLGERGDWLHLLFFCKMSGHLPVVLLHKIARTNKLSEEKMSENFSIGTNIVRTFYRYNLLGKYASDCNFKNFTTARLKKKVNRRTPFARITNLRHFGIVFQKLRVLKFGRAT